MEYSQVIAIRGTPWLNERVREWFTSGLRDKRPPDIYPGGLLKCGGEGTPAQGWENAVIFSLLPLHADNRLQHGVGSGDGLAVWVEQSYNNTVVKLKTSGFPAALPLVGVHFL